MNTVELIKKKRDGKSLLKEEIRFLVDGYCNQKIPDYQFSAFLMAGFIIGFNDSETTAFTNSMLHSGKVLELKSLKVVKVDKHSTGGVGDKTSLVIAPIVASLGINVPMISGRGLGHTGGTLDKLESIPGFKTNLNLNEFVSQLKKCNCGLIGQTKEITPADKFIYSLRDVTGTVESIPLITASIMSKKLAEGIDGLVLDVKTGSGAFMKTIKDSETLAKSMIKTAKAFNKKVIAFITDMNQPLGNYIGNWLEVYESVLVLKNKKADKDLVELCLNLAGAMIYLAGKAKSISEGKKKAFEQIKNGQAYKKFLEIVKLQDGKINYIENLEKYPKSKFSKKVFSQYSGFVSKIDTYKIGMASLELGAGRKTKEDKIDPKAGIIFKMKIGQKINKKDEIAILYSDDKSKLNVAEKMIHDSISFSRNKVSKPSLIKKILY
jgi:pyrimidine-nucleoside phosphorylase